MLRLQCDIREQWKHPQHLSSDFKLTPDESHLNFLLFVLKESCLKVREVWQEGSRYIMNIISISDGELLFPAATQLHYKLLV